MKVRMSRREYAAGMQAAKAAGMTFARWTKVMTERYLKRKMEAEEIAGKRNGLPVLTRKDSVSVYAGCDGVNGEIVRRAVAEAVIAQEEIFWNYRWRKDVLDSVIYARGFFGEKIGYEEAEKIMDERLEERKKELTTKNTKSAKKEREYDREM
jgi:hypothetical protein